MTEPTPTDRVDPQSHEASVGSVPAIGLGTIGLHHYAEVKPNSESLPRSPEDLKEEVIGILDEQDDEVFAVRVDAFIAARLEDLGVSEPIPYVSAMTPPAHGFLGPETRITPVVVGNSFMIDDVEIYSDLMSTLRAMYQMPGWRKQALADGYRRFLLAGIQYGQAKYFGANKESALEERDGIHFGVGVSFDEEGADVDRSIREFKGKAFCAERAATTQNMFAVLGFDTTLVIGEQKQDNGRVALHAWNIVLNSQHLPVLYDPMQPHTVHDEQGALIDVKPKAALAEGLLAGNSITVMQRTYVKQDGILRLQSEAPDIYEPPITSVLNFVE